MAHIVYFTLDIALQYMRGTTNTADAIDYVVDKMFNPQFGDRSGVPNYCIIITDGGSNNKEKTFQVCIYNLTI